MTTGRRAGTLSVIVPVLNEEASIPELVRRISKALDGGPRFDVIFVDDGSTEELSYVETLDSRIVLLRQHNAGLSAARNAGIRATSAPLIAFLDADDLWLPLKLEHQVAAMAAGGAVLCSTDFEIIDATGGRIGPGYGGANSYIDLLEGCAFDLDLHPVAVCARGRFA